MQNYTKYWFLEEFNFVRKMGRRNLMKMCELLEMIHFKKGEILSFNRANKNVVYFLKSGSLKVVSGHNNHTQYTVKKGNVFGELNLVIDDIVNADKAIALENGTVCFIEAEHMKVLMNKHVSLKNEVLKLSGLKIRKLQRKLEDLLYKDSKTRINEYLLDFIYEFGTLQEGRITAKKLLSHADIADLTNTSRQTVNNVMNQLRKEGIIQYDSKLISTLKHITDEEKN